MDESSGYPLRSKWELQFRENANPVSHCHLPDFDKPEILPLPERGASIKTEGAEQQPAVQPDDDDPLEQQPVHTLT